MEGAWKTVATIAIGILTIALGNLFGKLIQKQMVPWAILAATFVWEWGCFLTSRFTEFLLNRIYALTRLLAKFVQKFIFQRTDIQMDVESNELGGGDAQVGEPDASEGGIQGGRNMSSQVLHQWVECSRDVRVEGVQKSVRV